jgi:hypothetical protein
MAVLSRCLAVSVCARLAAALTGFHGTSLSMSPGNLGA